MTVALASPWCGLQLVEDSITTNWTDPLCALPIAAKVLTHSLTASSKLVEKCSCDGRDLSERLINVFHSNALLWSLEVLRTCVTNWSMGVVLDSWMVIFPQYHKVSIVMVAYNWKL